MARHPSPEELLDAAFAPEGAEADAARHVAGCDACRAHVDDMRAALARLGEAEVPEPPALYWQAFRAQVARRLEVRESAPGARRWAAWLGLPALASAAALALTLAPRLGWPPSVEGPPAPAAAHVPAWTPLPEAGDDTGLQVLQALAVAGDLGAAAECQGLDDCLSDLPEEDARSLAQAFRAELQGGEL